MGCPSMAGDKPWRLAVLVVVLLTLSATARGMPAPAAAQPGLASDPPGVTSPVVSISLPEKGEKGKTSGGKKSGGKASGGKKSGGGKQARPKSQPRPRPKASPPKQRRSEPSRGRSRPPRSPSRAAPPPRREPSRARPKASPPKPRRSEPSRGRGHEKLRRPEFREEARHLQERRSSSRKSFRDTGRSRGRVTPVRPVTIERPARQRDDKTRRVKGSSLRDERSRRSGKDGSLLIVKPQREKRHYDDLLAPRKRDDLTPGRKGAPVVSFPDPRNHKGPRRGDPGRRGVSDRRFLDDDAGWVGWSGGHDDQVTWWNHEPIGEHHGGSGWYHDDHHSYFDFSFSLSFGWYDSACFDYGYVYGPWYTYWYWDCHPWPWRYCGTGWWYPRYRWYVPYYRPAYCYASCDPFWWHTPVVYVTDVYHDDWYSRTTYVVEPEYPTLDEAWDLLAENRLFDALTAFARLTEVHPDDGLPRVGYAIVAGLTGDRPTSVYAMRRAFRDEPDALRYIPADDRLDDRLYELLEQFALEAQAGAGDLDGLFMLSAIRYLLGEEAVAHFAVEAAIREGDDSESAANLKALLDASLSDQLWEVVP